MRTPLLRWLSLRVRILAVAALFIGSLLPPYVPASALSSDDIPPSNQQFLFVEDGFLMKSSSLGTQGSRLAFGEGLLYTVKAGDSVESIARHYRIKPDTIRWANGLQAESALQAGQQLLILPVDGVMHVVRSGQTLEKIAELYDVSSDDIARQNNIRGGFLVAGQQLIIPGGKPIPGKAPAAAVIAQGDTEDQGSLHFTNQLTPRDIKLQLNLPSTPETHNQARGPLTSAAITITPLQMPCENCQFTQYYHPGHYAVDIQTRGGGPIFAAEDGVVIRADGRHAGDPNGHDGWNGGYGNVIEIDHGNGLVTLYGHNKELYVNVGDHVKRGQEIAWMGNTGQVHGPTGIHTHFEVRVNGVKKNPLLYLE